MEPVRPQCKCSLLGCELRGMALDVAAEAEAPWAPSASPCRHRSVKHRAAEMQRFSGRAICPACENRRGPSLRRNAGAGPCSQGASAVRSGESFRPQMEFLRRWSVSAEAIDRPSFRPLSSSTIVPCSWWSSANAALTLAPPLRLTAATPPRSLRSGVVGLTADAVSAIHWPAGEPCRTSDPRPTT